MNNDKDLWLKEYLEFSNTPVEPAPREILVNLKKRIFPNPWVVFSKLLVLHSISGFLSLAICHQFGLNPFQTEQSLMDWFMRVGGHHFCMVACGVVFMITTYLIASKILTLAEFETVRRYKWLQTSLLGTLSLSAFYFFGAELLLIFAILWLLGGLLGAALAIETTYQFRKTMEAL